MQARFLCGPAGSGKTFRCLAEVRAALQSAPDGPPLVFIAPKQATFQLERQLLTEGDLNGYTRLHILSFDRLARFIFEKFSAAWPEFLSDEGRVMVLRALLLRHENELKLFRGSARRLGFAQEAGRLLNEFQRHQLTGDKLRLLAENRNLGAELRNKMRELARLRERYSAWLEEHRLQDGNHLLEAAAEMLRASSRRFAPGLSALWLDGFAEMTPQELDLLAALLSSCERATLAFCLEKSGTAEVSWLSVWNTVGKTFEQCRGRVESLPDCKIEVEWLGRDERKSRFAQNPALRELEKRWPVADTPFVPQRDPLPEPGTQSQDSTESRPTLNCGRRSAASLPALRIVTCQNPEAEAVFAAREILKFVRAGNRFRDCAALVRNLDPFHKPLARTFRRYGIPFFLDRRESVSHHPLAELTRNAVRVAAFDWRQEDWFAALKTGFCPADETEIDRLENESLARGWRGKKWREPLEIPEDPQLEKNLERLRKRITGPFEIFFRQSAASNFQPTGKILAESLRELWSQLRVEETLERWNAAPPDPKEAGGRGPAVHAAVWEQMNLWLDNVELAFSGMPMPLPDWLAVLESGLASLTVGVIPPALDEVLIGAVDRARNPDLKFVLVLGANETIFPAAPVSPAILTDADRDELNQIIPLSGDLRERLARERYYGYIAFTRAAEKLAVTYSRNDAAGAPLNPSPFIARLRNIFPGLAIENFEDRVGGDDIVHVNELIPALVEIQDAAQGGAGTGFREGELPVAISRMMVRLGALREPDPARDLSPDLAEKLYGAVLKTSVSRLEEFAQCPFKFFVRSGLRAGERKPFELDARERGTFQHDVLKMFHEQLVAERKRWRDVTAREARERIGEIASHLAADFRGGLLRDSPRTKFAARVMTGALQDFVEVMVSWMRAQYQFDPTAVELEFGGENASAPAWEILLDGGHKLALGGRIDRIDLCRGPDGQSALAVVLDYKSGGKKLDAILMENGVQMQLTAYLSALRRFKNADELFGVKNLIPTGVFYVNLRGQFENGATRAEVLAGADAARRAAYRHTGRFDAGGLDKLDSMGAADQFTYARNQDGSLHKGRAEAMPRAEFEALLDNVEEQLRRIGNAIFSGAARVDPYRKGQETPCAYCDYRAACRIDPWTHRYRALNAAF